MSAALPPALVLAAGRGTRLAPLTAVRAKPAAPVSGTPLVVRVLRWLAGQGVSAAALNLHHLPHTITRCVGHGAGTDVAVRYSWEPVILGTAGGPRRALPLLGERFFVVNGDTLAAVDLQAMLREHLAGGAQVTLAAGPHPAPARYGGVAVDGGGAVRGFVPAGNHSGLHFLGVQLVEADVFRTLRDGEPAASIGGLYDALVAARPGAIRACHSDAAFHDIGKPADYLAASLAVARADGLAAPAPGARCRIDPGARLSRTAVWDDVAIAAGCRLSDCIVSDGVRLPAGSVFERQIITASGDGSGSGLRVTPLAAAHGLPAGA